MSAAQNPALPRLALTGKARLAGVMGWPVGPSRSPRLHGYWLARPGVGGAEALAASLGGPIRVMGWGERSKALEGAGLLVNATTQGMQGQPALELALDRLPPDAVVNDIVYVPLETPLLAAARQRGNPVVDG